VSIFGSIVSKIFGHREAAAAQPGAQPEAASSAPQSAAAPAGQQAPPAASPQGATAQTSTAQQQQQPVDVAAVLTDMAAKQPQKLDWRHSIVDLMKLLGLDSGLQARRELAQELGYAGDPGDSAAMNIWLHKQVMRKLAENGGKVPDELRS
jgi:3-oxoacyl-ACP reductase-like protein